MKTTPGSKDPSNTKSSDTEDNSVTFSLSALMAQGNNKPNAAPTTTATKDDSGLIDLNALAAMEETARPSPVPSHLGLFPFETPIAAAPPPVAPLPEVVEPPKPRRGLILFGAVGAVALAVGAFFIGMRGGQPDGGAKSSQSTIEASQTTPAQNDTPKAADPDKVVAADPGAAKEKEPAPVVSNKAPLPLGRGKLAKADTSDKKSSSDPPKDEKKAAPADPCHGDLLCAMQRATKK